MGRLVTATMESGDATTEGFAISGSAAFATDKAFTQTRSFKLAAADSGAGISATYAGASGRTVYQAATLYIASGTITQPAYLLQAQDVTPHEFRVLAYTDGHLWAQTPAFFTDLGVCPRDQWFLLETATTFNSAANETYEVRINGVSVFSQNEAASTTNITGFWPIASFSGAVGVDIWMGHWIVNDSQGANENSWVGQRKVYLIFPTSDSAVGTGWIVPGGGTTNLFEAVNNAPPTGIADSTSAANAGKMIHNRTSTSTGNYDAQLPSYASVGIVGSIVLVQQVLLTGQPVSTARAGAMNVAPDGSTFGTEDTFTTFYAGAVQGTHPAGWLRQVGAPRYNPSVSGGQAPKLRVGKRVANVAVVSVDAMGLLVDERFAAPPPRPPRMPLLVR